MSTWFVYMHALSHGSYLISEPRLSLRWPIFHIDITEHESPMASSQITPSSRRISGTPSFDSSHSKQSRYSSSSASSAQSPCHDMHQKLTGQMQAHHERWVARQERQSKSFHGAAQSSKVDPSASDAYQTKRVHPHLDKVASTMRRIRG